MGLPFDNDVKLNNIKQQGNFKSEAVWVYLNSALPFSAIITYILHNSLGCEPFGIILSSLLGRFNEGNIILLKKPSGPSWKKLFLCRFIFCLFPSSTGADFTKGLKSRFRLKSKTLVLNFESVVLDLADFTKQQSP